SAGSRRSPAHATPSTVTLRIRQIAERVPVSDTPPFWQVPGARRDAAPGMRPADLTDDQRAAGAAWPPSPDVAGPGEATMEHPAVGHAAAGSATRRAHGPYGIGRDGERPQDTAAEWRRRIDAVADRPSDDGFSFWKQPERTSHSPPPHAARSSHAPPSAPASPQAPAQGAPSDPALPSASFGAASAAGQASSAEPVVSAVRTSSSPV